MARISRHIGTNNWHGKTWPIWEMNMAVYRSVNLSSFFFPKIYFPIFLVFMLYVTYSKWTACLQVQIQLKLKLLLKPVLRSGNYLISAQVPVLFHVLGSIPAPTPAAPAKKRHSSLNICLLTFDIWQICLQGGSCWNRAECLPAYHGCQLFRNSPAHQAHGRSKYTVHS